MKKKLVLLSLLFTLNVPFAAGRVDDEGKTSSDDVTSSARKVALSDDANFVIAMLDSEANVKSILQEENGRNTLTTKLLEMFGAEVQKEIAEVVSELAEYFKDVKEAVLSENARVVLAMYGNEAELKAMLETGGEAVFDSLFLLMFCSEEDIDINGIIAELKAYFKLV